MTRNRVHYLRITINKFRTIWCQIYLRLLVILAAACVILGALYGYVSHQNVEKPIQVALVIPGEQQDIRLITQLLMSMDSINQTVELTYLDEAKAKSGYESGLYDVVIHLGEDMYDNLYYGANEPITIQIKDMEKNGQKLFLELIRDGVLLIDTTQASCYALSDILIEEGVSQAIGEATDQMMRSFIGGMYEARKQVKTQMVAATGSVDTASYYVALFFLWYMVIHAFAYHKLYEEKDWLVEKRLRQFGVNYFYRMLCKLFVMTIALWTHAVIGLIVLQKVGEKSGLYEIWLNGSQMLQLLLFSLSLSCIGYGCQSLGSGTKEKKRITVLSWFIAMLIGGCMVPTSYLPFIKSANWISFLPTTMLREWTIAILFRERIALVGIAGWSVGFLFLAVIWDMAGRKTPVSASVVTNVNVVYHRLQRGGSIHEKLCRGAIYLKWVCARRSPVVVLFLAFTALVLVIQIQKPVMKQEILVYGERAEEVLACSEQYLEQSCFSYTYADNPKEAKQAVCNGEVLGALEVADEPRFYWSGLLPSQLVAKESSSVLWFLCNQDTLEKEQLEVIFGEEADTKVLHQKLRDHYEVYMHGEYVFRVNIDE